ncbi:hypothetical protein PCANC_02751 [Puccinia coronata f. sp. avenae]|uniref:Uncharacterized protein n=1 Tax=Puccinia coronata f. sp. avenae TaxID=200324 RepID=A0A2N5VY83_9BASI|nr:hypothetical protein PCANC_02751 [Puccinia coronata f. sp. avenae]
MERDGPYLDLMDNSASSMNVLLEDTPAVNQLQASSSSPSMNVHSVSGVLGIMEVQLSQLGTAKSSKLIEAQMMNYAKIFVPVLAHH